MSDQNGSANRVPMLGDRVKIRGPLVMKGRISELRGNLGPDGVDIFGIELEYTDDTAYIEVRGDQLIFLDEEAPAQHTAPSASE